MSMTNVSDAPAAFAHNSKRSPIGPAPKIAVDSPTFNPLFLTAL
ncbi:hypothetical protein QGM71_06710 [Virgibacillus sp. C22-A2]|uniref:Uncharacterized protein n=1 Tax=Virgibacillus tibetensis TaxID=3042313 RepID=A0ABU6KDN0_9BACI|nr:hypothetical protein [Virgibacillus sp. C22-A2]